MKRSKQLVVVIIIVIVVFSVNEFLLKGAKKNVLPAQSITETFIVDHLEARNHLIRTNITDRAEEYLSESVGLWLYYLQEVQNEGRFAKQVEAFNYHFYQKGQIIPWVIEQEKRENINASIDDLRIMIALHKASEQFQTRPYERQAKAIGQFVVEHQIRARIITDFYDPQYSYASNIITLSYIIPEAYDYLQEEKMISSDVYDANKALLVDAPLFERSFFFPKNYNVEQQTYHYDERVNMIDQYYVGFHRAEWGGDVSKLVQFTKEKLAADGKIYGGYHLHSAQPTVTYESASTYALAILMMLALQEHDVAKQLYSAMQTLRVDDENSDYYGGYIDIWSKDTHMFDNVLPLIAERRGIDAGIFTE